VSVAGWSVCSNSGGYGVCSASGIGGGSRLEETDDFVLIDPGVGGLEFHGIKQWISTDCKCLADPDLGSLTLELVRDDQSSQVVYQPERGLRLALMNGYYEIAGRCPYKMRFGADDNGSITFRAPLYYGKDTQDSLHSCGSKSQRDAARYALARLHVGNYHKEVLDEAVGIIDTNRFHYWGNSERFEAFKKLAYIGGKEAIQKLGEYLFDDTDAPRGSRDVRDASNREAAAWALNQALAPTDRPPYSSDDRDVPKCRDWWKKHKDKYK
jgi:hypothetical protein